MWDDVYGDCTFQYQLWGVLTKKSWRLKSNHTLIKGTINYIFNLEMFFLRLLI